MNLKTRILTLAATGAIVVAGVAGATGFASAQEPTATPQATKHEKRVERRDNFLGKVATNLGITLDQLKQAFRSAATQTVDDALANGDITQAQADKIKANIESGKNLGLGQLLGIGRRVNMLQRLRAGIAKSAADAIGIQPKDLVSELKSGKSIADVASEHNVNLDTVKTQITNDAKAKLDAARRRSQAHAGAGRQGPCGTRWKSGQDPEHDPRPEDAERRAASAVTAPHGAADATGAGGPKGHPPSGTVRWLPKPATQVSLSCGDDASGAYRGDAAQTRVPGSVASGEDGLRACR